MLLLSDDITVVIPAIPPRRTNYLREALNSVYAQTMQPKQIIVEEDVNKLGAPRNRDNGLAKVKTDWVAFLDDDDVLYPGHLQALYRHAMMTDVDLVYPWFDVDGGTDPFPQWEGVPWDCAHPHQIPVTVLAKTEALRAIGGYSGEWDLSLAEDPGVDKDGNRAGEDYMLILRLCAAGYRISHLSQRTWSWRHHSANSMGLPSRW